MKHLIYGIRKSVLHLKEYSDSVRKITSGSMALVLAVHVLRYIMTVVRNMAAVSQVVQWAVTVTDIWKYGIMYSLSLIMTDMVITQTLYRRILILVWDLKDLRLLFRMLILYLMLIHYRHFATKFARWLVFLIRKMRSRMCLSV